MRGCASVIPVLVPVFLGLLLLPALVAAGPSLVNVTATLNYLGGTPGNQTFRFDYSVENVGVEPSLAGFIVFFDNDALNRTDFVSYTVPAGWEEVFVTPEAPGGSWNCEWDELFGTNRILPGEILEGFSITFTWNDPNALPSSQFFEAWNGVVHEGYTVIVPGSSLLGSIAGTVVTVCGGNTGPADGVTVDLFTVDNVMLASTATDINGQYSFTGLALGDYKITIVTPAGFTADLETKTATVSMGSPTVVNFQLTCLPITPDARTIGYWKHQVNSYLSGKGKAQESLENMLYWTDEIAAHFNNNLLNPVKMIEIDPATDRLIALDRLLTVNKDGTMLERAKQQALALLLNVVSLKLSQAYVISPDGANVSQAITYVNQLIMDKVLTNDESAKDIADYINNGRVVPAGWIPTSTPVIYYERDRKGAIVYLGKGYPNPFTSTASIAFALKGEALVPVDLKVFDVSGRVVKTLINDALEPGQHMVSWNGMGENGAKVSSGIYFYELRTPTSSATGKLVYRR